MEENYNNEIFVRWLDDDLSPKELVEFENSPKFPLYKKIATKTSELTTIGFDENEILLNIKSHISSRKSIPKTGKTRSLFSKVAYGAVASIALLLGIFFFLNRSTTYTTSYGETLAIKLPDNSEVILNSNSKISYKKRNWNTNRTLNLDGEAYFKVEKGSTFAVETDLGNVTVLGTQFNTNTVGKVFDVICYEGKVKVNTKINERILTKGNAFRELKNTSEDYLIKNNKPTWISGETTFNNTSLSFVIKKLQNQYNVIIDASTVDSNQKITGSFTHNSLKIALQTVLSPLKLTFNHNNDVIKLEKSN
ncbi:FecR family protein [Tenacibaculum sp.]|nr:FecR family protein [Tenacibaculum sp.]